MDIIIEIMNQNRRATYILIGLIFALIGITYQRLTNHNYNKNGSTGIIACANIVAWPAVGIICVLMGIVYIIDIITEKFLLYSITDIVNIIKKKKNKKE